MGKDAIDGQFGVVGAPATSAIPVVVDDTGEFEPCRALWIGTGGDLRVRMHDGGEATFQNVPDGIFLPLSVTRVYDTNTTASGIIRIP